MVGNELILRNVYWGLWHYLCERISDILINFCVLQDLILVFIERISFLELNQIFKLDACLVRVLASQSREVLRRIDAQFFLRFPFFFLLLSDEFEYLLDIVGLTIVLDIVRILHFLDQGTFA